MIDGQPLLIPGMDYQEEQELVGKLNRNRDHYWWLQLQLIGKAIGRRIYDGKAHLNVRTDNFNAH